MSNAEIITWVADQQRRAFDRLSDVFLLAEPRRAAQRTNVAWMDALRLVTNNADADLAVAVRGWKAETEAREDLALPSNAELRGLMLGVADAILSHIEETDR